MRLPPQYKVKENGRAFLVGPRRVAWETSGKRLPEKLPNEAARQP
jgi:hypothetical protein